LFYLKSYKLVIPDVKNDVIQGEGLLGKNDITWGKLTALARHPTRKVNKAN
jgi:hypothetical protein